MDHYVAVADDDWIVVNGEKRKVDLSPLRSEGIHAVEFFQCDERGKCKGRIQWRQDPLEERKMNTKLEDKDEFHARFGWLLSKFQEAPTETQRHARARADKVVAAAEETLQALKMKEPPGNERGDNALADRIEKMERAVANRKRERDEVYSGTRAKMDPSGKLMRKDD